MKVMISQPMKNRKKDDILAERKLCRDTSEEHRACREECRDRKI